MILITIYKNIIQIIIPKTNNIKNITENNETFKNNNLDNIIDSIIEFYYSNEQLKNIINSQEANGFKMINKYWLKAFKREYLFNEIKSILSMEKNSLIYKKIISDFLIIFDTFLLSFLFQFISIKL